MMRLVKSGLVREVEDISAAGVYLKQGYEVEELPQDAGEDEPPDTEKAMRRVKR